jgi:hypothetical protein
MRTASVLQCIEISTSKYDREDTHHSTQVYTLEKLDEIEYMQHNYRVTK